MTEKHNVDPEKDHADIQPGLVIVSYLASLYGLATFSLYQSKFVEHINIFQSIIESDDQIKHAPLKHFERISKEMEIVYRLAIFDAFLTNMTRYALVKRPGKAIGQAQMHVGKLINSTKSAIINTYIDKKLTSIGVGSFIQRIIDLEKILDEKFDVSDLCKCKLRTILKIRNEIVHTTGNTYSFSLDENMSMSESFEAKKIEIPDDLDICFLEDLASIIYEIFVVRFLGRELQEIERIAVNGIRSANVFDLLDAPLTDSA